MATPGDAHTHGTRREFFDGIASGWDARVATDAFLDRLRSAVADLSVAPDEVVLDLGCGTGNLARVLCEALGADGRVIAVDFSSAMLEVARAKLRDETRVSWVDADARSIPVPDGAVDRVICFSAWPHFQEHPRVARELFRVLRSGGRLHVLHIDGRETINRIHGNAGGAVTHDTLRPATDLSALFVSVGFEALAQVDTAERYLVSVRRPSAG